MGSRVRVPPRSPFKIHVAVKAQSQLLTVGSQRNAYSEAIARLPSRKQPLTVPRGSRRSWRRPLAQAVRGFLYPCGAAGVREQVALAFIGERVSVTGGDESQVTGRACVQGSLQLGEDRQGDPDASLLRVQIYDPTADVLTPESRCVDHVVTSSPSRIASAKYAYEEGRLAKQALGVAD